MLYNKSMGQVADDYYRFKVQDLAIGSYFFGLSLAYWVASIVVLAVKGISILHCVFFFACLFVMQKEYRKARQLYREVVSFLDTVSEVKRGSK